MVDDRDVGAVLEAVRHVSTYEDASRIREENGCSICVHSVRNLVSPQPCFSQHQLTSNEVDRTNIRSGSNGRSVQSVSDRPQNGRTHTGKHLPCYARSPSPFVLDDNYIYLKNYSGAILEGGSVSMVDNTQGAESACAWSPSTINPAILRPQSFIFAPAASFAETQFISDILTTANLDYRQSYTDFESQHIPMSHAYKLPNLYNRIVNT